MRSAQLLDILGNENRRKILQLLASRPCYMSEIAERLDVGAKAVLGHLELLVRAGLIEARVDDQRRKYFNIADNLQLEVSVSPYSFEIEMTTIAISVAPEHRRKDVHALTDLILHYKEIQKLLEQRQQIMLEYQKIQADITHAMGLCMDAIGKITEDNIEAEILYALLKKPMDQRALSIQLGIHEHVLEEYLTRMERKEIIKEDRESYSIC
ncbi:putative transcriptional regulator [Candidatus Methanoperedens nitroreducens]|uniref:Putative transcriptional regulator n=1 Tax=Candidatus Methanoperedens nitratireducens TaxID=1392998 RepID=A0A062V8J1_9EURY|nr:ArsR family transcriptional regulator [Candidatus Methanoperedens nitroreducens]KCZ72074.1 putative transcriptional regulator [Candidatus Methanoperedens nitroreducens]MDJ1421951.1 ArsR family transcriptional regulator [Candidatus Methanoperedens sp.]